MLFGYSKTYLFLFLCTSSLVVYFLSPWPNVFQVPLQVALAIDKAEPQRTLEGQGSLIAIRLVIGDKKAKLFLVGKEAAKLNLAKDAQILEITAFRDDATKEILTYSPDGEAYTLKALPKWKEPYSLSVRTKIKDTEENIKIQVNKRVP